MNKFGLIKKIFLFALFLLLTAGVATMGYLYFQTRKELSFLSSQAGQQELAKKEIEAVTKKLQKLIILPTEDPVVATIIDADYLASQSAFYSQSQNGDKLLVYPQAKRAIIYSPERNVIVNAGPLLVEPSAQPTTGEENLAPQAKISVELRNGSDQAGKASNAAQNLDTQVFEVKGIAEAASKDHKETIVIRNDSSIDSTLVSKLAQQVGGKLVDTIPAGEAPTSAQILVIMGSGG